MVETELKQMTDADMQNGVKVRLAREIEIYPIGIFAQGLTGIVVEVDHNSPDVFAHVLLDKYFPELDEWDNCLQVGRTDRPDEFASYPADYEQI